MTDKGNSENRLGLLNLLVLVLSIYVLLALIVDTVFTVPPEIARILNFVDNGICIFFLIEFGVRFYRADNKLKFMKWGWIDLISSIPNVDFLRAGRTLRLIRLLRILRAFRSTKHLVNHVFQNKAQGAFTTVIILAVILIIFSSISVLQFETDPNSNIKTAEDALWWSYVTITTVGYGDKFPVTTGGRIIGVFLMTGGVGLFGTFTAFVSSWFLADKKKEDDKED
jgi:voltage-gated potassium channel